MRRYLPHVVRAALAALLLAACAADAPRSDVTGDVVEDTDRGRPDAHVADSGDEPDVDAPDGALDGGEDAPDAPADAAVDGADDATMSDTDASSDAADDAAPDTSSDVSSDAAPDAPADTAPEVVECPPPTGAYTGVLVEDTDGGTLDVDDVVRVTVNVHAPTPSAEASWLVLRHLNLEADRSSVTLDGAPFSVPGTADRWLLELPDTGDHVVVYEASVRSDDALVVVLSSIERAEAGCPEPRSRSGALFQITGGEIKTSSCVDMADYRSLQVAPVVPAQNTDAYAVANGVRDDLRADGFIFCPQAPTIVHAAEFCLQRSGDQRIALSGSYEAAARWEVDDFILVEVLDDDDLLADGFTSQSHSGHPDRFWCSETSTHMCTSACTAELIEVATDRSLTPLAVTSAEGDTPREFADGEVALDTLLPSGGTVDVRITALDTGVEGTLTPALYLVSDAP